MQRMTVSASPAQLWDALLDFEHYPVWAHDLKRAEVITTDDQGRPSEVAFRAAAMGRSTSYTLAYDYSEEPRRLSWRLVEGDIMGRLDGSYSFKEVDGDADSTDVEYRLVVDLVVPLPGFVKRRAEARILHTALDELKAHVEGTHPPDQRAE